MVVRLPDELRTAIATHPDTPLRLVDEQTQTACVLVPADEFERLQSARGEDGIQDTFAGQIEAAMRAGWADPGMDEYDNYDAHRRQA